ncbi:phage tail protein I [Thioclava sp.]|uniref:phage tail protein I n=1 Tax=Thioclava sp. TaxID=1933450 RepID=UPI00324272C1
MADSLLPPNATELETALEEVAANLLGIEVPVDQLWSPANIPEALLGYLAWALSVDRWDSNWTVERKREVIAASVAVHRRKGTPWAVQRALDAQGFTARLLEWNRQQNPGAPFTFQLFLESDQTGFSQAEVQDLLKWIDEVKSVRSHLAGIFPIATSAAPAQVIVLPSISATNEVGPATIETANLIDGGVADTDFQFFPTLDGGVAAANSSDHEVNP